MASSVLALLLLGELCLPPARAGSHSHRCLYSALSEGLPGAPPFTAVGYVDDVEISAFSSGSRTEPRAPWMVQFAESDPRYWETETRILQGAEAVHRADVMTVMNRHNQTAGLHTFQVMYGCEIRDDSSIGGFYQYAYDGRDFLSFDKENMKFTPAMEVARVTADLWNQDEHLAHRDQAYLEKECIEWLQKYLNYGKERLLRRVPPQAKISRRKSDTATTLTCYAFGFYPREIEVKWMRNEVEADWKTKVILPNTDGTYQIRTTVELPEGHDEDDYRCLVDHIGLEDIITKVYEEESGTRYISLIVGLIANVCIVVAVITAAVIWKKRNCPDKGKRAAANQGENGYYAVCVLAKQDDLTHPAAALPESSYRQHSQMQELAKLTSFGTLSYQKVCSLADAETRPDVHR